MMGDEVIGVVEELRKVIIDWLERVWGRDDGVS